MTDLVERIRKLNSRYIRKPECKATLEEAATRIEQLEGALALLEEYAKHLACLYRPETNPETSDINDDGIDHMLHCCDWNDVYEICRSANGDYSAKERRIKEIDEKRKAITSGSLMLRAKP